MVWARPGSPCERRDLQRTLRDGVWFIDLAGLEDPHLVAKAVISGLGVADQSGQWPTSLVISHLASREALLILDTANISSTPSRCLQTWS